MITKRLIACFDVIGNRLTKAKRFQNNIDIGDIYEYAQKVYASGIDEIIYYDITASVEKRIADIDVVKKVAKNVFVPFTVGGGIKTVDGMLKILNAGAEKISIDSMAVRRPELITEGAKEFGCQCIVVSMQVKKVAPSRTLPSGYEVLIDGARVNTGIDAMHWAIRVEELGAGEIVLNSIDSDGTMSGYDTLITGMISKRVGIPVVASGGGGEPKHLKSVLTATRATAAVISSILYSTRMRKNYSVAMLKDYLEKEGVAIRPHVEQPTETAV